MNEPSPGPGKKHLAVYAIVERNERSYWLKVGAAFTNSDGSIAVLLDAVPLGSHKLQIREQRPWEQNRAAGVANGPPAVAELTP